MFSFRISLHCPLRLPHSLHPKLQEQITNMIICNFKCLWLQNTNNLDPKSYHWTLVKQQFWQLLSWLPTNVKSWVLQSFANRWKDFLLLKTVLILHSVHCQPSELWWETLNALRLAVKFYQLISAKRLEIFWIKDAWEMQRFLVMFQCTNAKRRENGKNQVK